MPDELKPLAGEALAGYVRSTDKITMVIQDNGETFSTWLHRNKERFKDKKVEITIQIIEEKESQ